jgi:hypothetical protein
VASLAIKMDELEERHPNRWLCKEAKFKVRDEAQRRNWTIYEAIKIYKRYPWVCQREVEPMGSTPLIDGPEPLFITKL